MMKKMLGMVVAAAICGVANAAASYNYSAEVYVSNYAAKDVTPGYGPATWYSCYALTQASAQQAMKTGDKVTYATYAAWLGENFDAGRDATIEQGMAVPFMIFSGKEPYQYAYLKNASTGEKLGDSILVCFFDNGTDVAYKVIAQNSTKDTTFFADDLSQASSAWTAVPEPTSGLLMLLGVAGLALKRKRA